MVVELRRAGAADAALLAPLCAEHARFERIEHAGGAHFVARLAAALAAGRLHAWLAIDGDLPIGYASVTIDFSTLSALPFAHLDCLYLREAARGQGVGRQLLNTVRHFARERGCREVQWQTPMWNTAATGFYLCAGATVLDKKRFCLRSP